jgi:hypothetical protein
MSATLVPTPKLTRSRCRLMASYDCYDVGAGDRLSVRRRRAVSAQIPLGW